MLGVFHEMFRLLYTALCTYYGILLIAAVVPPLVIMVLVYRADTIEKEPVTMLTGLFLHGLLAMFPILIVEMILGAIANIIGDSGYFYLFLSYFVIPGFVEEYFKYRVLKKRTWDNPEFDYYFDAVVYAVFVSLGFAAVENVLYVMESGFLTAVSRAVFSIPGHTIFGIVMGSAFAGAKHHAVLGHVKTAELLRRSAYIKAAILHGLYDFLLVGFGWVFYVYFALLVIYGVWTFRRASRNDRPITQGE